MRARQLGRASIEITRVGFGAWAIGGDLWGSQDDRDSVASIRRALELGVSWIDTAPAYGAGHSEEVIARALSGLGDRPYVFTKCGLVVDESGGLSGRLKAESIREELEGSLRRLETDVIDLYQIHWPFPGDELEEGWSTLAELKAEGKVRLIGASNFNVEQLRRAGAIAPVDSLQSPYSLLRRGIEDAVLPFCEQEGIGVIVYEALHAGLLSGAMTKERASALGDWRQRDLEFSPPRLLRNLEFVERLRTIGARHGRSPGEVAIAWTLRHPAVTGAIVGFRHPDQVDGLAGSADFELAEDELEEIEGLLA